MIGSEGHFRETLGQERARVLFDGLSSGTSQAREIVATNGLTRALSEPVLAFDLSQGFLREALEPMDGVELVERGQQLFWVIDDTYALRVKKLRTGYRYSNHASGQQAMISHQEVLEDLPVRLYVVVGARYDETTGLPVEFVAVKYFPGPLTMQDVEWVAPLDDIAGGAYGPITPTLPLSPAPAVVAPAAIRARRQRAQNQPSS